MPEETSTPQENSDTGRYGGAAAFYDFMKWQTDAQDRRVDTINTRGGTLLGQVSAMLPVALGLLGFTKEAVNVPALMFVGAALAAYGVTLWHCFAAIKARQYHYRPWPNEVQPISVDYSDQNIRWWIANEQARVIEGNRAAAEAKAVSLGYALKGAVVMAVFLSLAFAAALLRFA